jgi:hypothetical protein
VLPFSLFYSIYIINRIKKMGVMNTPPTPRSKVFIKRRQTSGSSPNRRGVCLSDIGSCIEFFFSSFSQSDG